jgi:two-component system phosphate regulon sensor histidine kinase PhoR
MTTEREFAAYDESGDETGNDQQQQQADAYTQEDKAARHAALMSDLLRMAASLAALSDTRELFQQSVVYAVDALPMVDAGVLWLYDEREGRLRMASHYGLPFDAATLAELQKFTINPGEGLTGQAFSSMHPLIIQSLSTYLNHIESLRRAYRSLLIQLYTQTPAIKQASMVLVPLRAGAEKIGVIEFLCLEPTTLDPDIQMLHQALPHFSSLLATTIKNKQLYDQAQIHRSRLDTFDAVVTAISTATDLQDMLNSVLEVLLAIMPVSSGAIFLFDPIQSLLTLGAQRGLPDAFAETFLSVPVDTTAYEEVVRYGQPVLRSLKVGEHGEHILLEYGLEHCACLPLLAGGTVVGMLGLYSDPTIYDNIDMVRLMPLSNQVGFAIANVRMYEDSYLERYKLTTVVNSIAEGVVVCDSRGRLVLANETAMALLSLDAVPYDQPLSEMVDFYRFRTLENEPLPVDQLPMARALSGETFHDYRLMLYGISGANSIMSFSGAPVRSDMHTIEGAVVVFRDMTETQKLERAKDEFLAMAAHELRNPLASVRGYAELLLRRERQRADTDSRDVRGLSLLSQQVAHMLSMVDNLLDVSRLDAGQIDVQMQRINLVSLAAQVLDHQRPSAAGYELVLDAALPELWVECDEIRMYQVLTNLVSNAIKYSPPHTTVTIRVSRRTVPLEPLLLLSANSETNDPVRHEALVEIVDRGYGISPEQQERLFQRFYRVKSRRVEGLGLGLYLSRQFILMHGGDIWLESAEGQGSTFYFTLPIQVE